MSPTSFLFLTQVKRILYEEEEGSSDSSHPGSASSEDEDIFEETAQVTEPIQTEQLLFVVDSTWKHTENVHFWHKLSYNCLYKYTVAQITSLSTITFYSSSVQTLTCVLQLK